MAQKSVFGPFFLFLGDFFPIFRVRAKIDFSAIFFRFRARGPKSAFSQARILATLAGRVSHAGVPAESPFLSAFVYPTTGNPARCPRPWPSFPWLFSFYQGIPQIYHGCSLPADPPKTLENQGKHPNNQGNSLLKVYQGNPKNQGKEGQGGYPAGVRWNS